VPRPADDLARGLIALGEAIKKTRKEKGLTQEGLAQRVDLHVSYISVIEAGRRNPTWSVVRRISQALSLPLADLARLAEEMERKL
jgi:transcriptional regulator with XRE-family HTH domain